eukprot:11166056-Lingulodinium_polyedra.AAC.1
MRPLYIGFDKGLRKNVYRGVYDGRDSTLEWSTMGSVVESTMDARGVYNGLECGVHTRTHWTTKPHQLEPTAQPNHTN